MRLIDADALADWLTKPTGFQTNCEDCPSSGFECLKCVVGEVIKNAPTIDPVKHGRWVHTGAPSARRFDPPREVWQCSLCGFYDFDFGPDTYNYCPKCGARMDANE